MNKKSILGYLLALLPLYLVQAQDSHWECDFRSFQYDMTAYVNLSIDGSVLEVSDNYEIAAFYDDECRGVASIETIAATGVKYYYLRIRSNASSGEVITFKYYDKTKQNELVLDTTVDFDSGNMIGLPSELFTLSRANTYKLKYVVDGKVVETKSVKYGTKITAIDTPNKEGHTFSGWSEVPETMPAKDVTVTGSFTVNSYTLTYTVDGKEHKKETVAYGTKITAIDAPTKEGHTFSGWSEVPETMPASNVIISGTFTANKYLVTFKIGNKVIATNLLEYGATIAAPEAPEREGYTFNGWGEVAETVPANDVTYEGTYTVNIYKVYYYVGEKLVHMAEVAYGEAIPEYVYEPTEEDYTFLGWVGDTYEAMPAHDVTFTANIYDAIEQLTIDKSQLTIYDLGGRKIEIGDIRDLRKGIYIVNGKKMIIKD